MSSLIDLQRLKRLPSGPDVWQLAILTMPQWITGESRASYRPRIALCRSAELGVVGASDPSVPEQPGLELALRAIHSMTKLRQISTRPACVEVRDMELRRQLGPMLEAAGIEIHVVDELDLIDEVEEDMHRRFGKPADGRSQFTAAVGLDRIRAFAEAAVAFHDAAPWNHLTDLDLIQVESAGAPRGMTWFIVVGAVGMARGVLFLNSQLDHAAMVADEPDMDRLAETPCWSISLGGVEEMPLIDHEFWRANDLPRAAGERFPLLAQLAAFGPGEQADPARVRFAEALLRALAETTEDNLDSGRWFRTVRSFEGDVTISLALPGVLAVDAQTAKRSSGRRSPATQAVPLDCREVEQGLAQLLRSAKEQGIDSPEELNAYFARQAGKPLPSPRADSTDRGQAEALVHRALQAAGRARVMLAREATRRWVDCADAWALLAESMPDPARSLELYREAVAAAERALGPDALRDRRGHFWSVLETRPYMRARLGLAFSLWDAGDIESALGHWSEMIELDPGDHQGARYPLVHRLLTLGRDDDAARVLARFTEDQSAEFAYARVLVTFRRTREGDAANRALESATRSNPHVLKYLLAPEGLPDDLPAEYAPHSEEEAQVAADALSDAWATSPGAVDWLRGRRLDAKQLRRSRLRR